MKPPFILHLAATQQEMTNLLVEASFQALVAAAWAHFDALRFAYHAKAGSPAKVPDELLTDWVETSFLVVYELLSPQHPFRTELQRYVREVALPSLRSGALIPPRLHLVKPSGDDEGSR